MLGTAVLNYYSRVMLLLHRSAYLVIKCSSIHSMVKFGFSCREQNYLVTRIRNCVIKNVQYCK